MKYGRGYASNKMDSLTNLLDKYEVLIVSTSGSFCQRFHVEFLKSAASAVLQHNLSKDQYMLRGFKQSLKEKFLKFQETYI